MAEKTQAPAAASPKPAKNRASGSKRTGNTVSELIIEILSMSKCPKGMSVAALKKCLAIKGYDVNNNKSRIRISIKDLVLKGVLVQTKGTGASGSFKLIKKNEKPKKEAVKKRAADQKSRKKVEKTAMVHKTSTKNPKKEEKKTSAAKKHRAKKAAKPKVTKAAVKKK